jgi:hypothetical protein
MKLRPFKKVRHSSFEARYKHSLNIMRQNVNRINNSRKTDRSSQHNDSIIDIMDIEEVSIELERMD